MKNSIAFPRFSSRETPRKRMKFLALFETIAVTDRRERRWPPRFARISDESCYLRYVPNRPKVITIAENVVDSTLLVYRQGTVTLAMESYLEQSGSEKRYRCRTCDDPASEFSTAFGRISTNTIFQPPVDSLLVSVVSKKRS